jgi:hypothetical protein
LTIPKILKYLGMATPSFSCSKCFRTFRTCRAKLSHERIGCRSLLIRHPVLDTVNVSTTTGILPKFVHARIPFLVSDHPEAQKLCCMYESAMASHPCRFCLFSWESEAHLHPPRRLPDMIALIETGTTSELKKFSLHRQKVELADIPGLDVFRTPICRLHGADHGIFVHLLKMVISIVKQQGN